MKKILLFLVIGMFLINLISAECSLPTVKQGSPIQLTQRCADGSCTNVFLTSIIFPNQTYALTGVYAMETNNNIDYNYSFLNTNTIGTYAYTSVGDVGGTNISQTCSFEITKSGFTLEIGESILYLFLLLGSLFMFIFFFYFSITIPYSKKETGPKGEEITVKTKLKYVKLFSMLFAYMSFLWFLTMLSSVTLNFINIDSMKSLITNFYRVYYIMAYPVTLTILFILFVEIWKEIFMVIFKGIILRLGNYLKNRKK